MPKLYYFDMEGRAEIVRLTYALTGQKLEDFRYPIPEWFEKYKKMSPSEQCPFMEFEDNKVLTESVALCIYAGKKAGLVPDDPFELAKMFEIILQVQNIYAHKRKFYRLTEAERAGPEGAELAKTLNEGLVKTILTITDQLVASSQCEKTGFAVGGKFTIADIVIYDMARGMTKVKQFGLEIDPTLIPHLMKTHDVVLEKVKAAGYHL